MISKRTLQYWHIQSATMIKKGTIMIISITVIIVIMIVAGKETASYCIQCLETDKSSTTHTCTHAPTLTCLFLTLSFALVSAPLSRRALTTSTWLWEAACRRDVHPIWYEYDNWIGTFWDQTDATLSNIKNNVKSSWMIK